MAKVVIVGAGISGLTAAKELTSQGFDVTIVEARDRIGGRLHTLREGMNGAAVDVGGAWIHGVKGNPIAELARRLELPLAVTDWDQQTTTLHPTGGMMSQIMENRGTKLWKRAEKQRKKLVKSMRRNKDTDVSLWDGLKRSMDADNMTEDEITLLRFWVQAWIESDYAEQAERLSFMNFDQDDEFDGHHCLFPEGYDGIIQHLASGLNIVKSRRVTKIRCDVNGAVVTLVPSSTSGCEDRTADGAGGVEDPVSVDLSCDYCIVTLPLGVLKVCHKDMFTPPLTKGKARAIERLGVSAMNKVVLRFDSVTWPFFKRDEAQMWERFTPDNRFSGFINLAAHRPQGTAGDKPGPPIVVAYLTADFAREIENWEDEKVVSECMAALREMHRGGSGWKSGQVVKPVEFADPVATYVTRWVSDEYSRGSYSVIEVGGSGDDYNILSQPHGPRGRVRFAGEATNQTYPATVTGAHLTGIREAKALTEIAAGSVRESQTHCGGAGGGGASLDAIRVTPFAIIDVNKLQHNDLEELQRLDTACRGDGFFYVCNHGVDPVVLTRAKTLATAFFQLDLADKDTIAIDKSPHFHGYSHVNAEVTLGVPDFKETIDFGIEQEANGSILVGPNQWPDEIAFPSVAGYKETMLTCISEMRRVALAITKGLATIHNVDEKKFISYFDDPFAFMRLIRYPPQLEGSKAKIGVGEHSDYGCLALINQDDVGGLEACVNGKWVKATPIPNTFVVNLGDMLESWSGGLYKATRHRVINPSTQRQRISHAFFFDPSLFTPVGVIEEFAAALGPDRPPADARFAGFTTYGEYVLDAYQRSFPKHPSSTKLQERAHT